ncbi:hypothetical protein [Pyrobaculum aerophilum]|uniref:hypothetical protein n=1 Tax=Pyrobaculum aerophilum TaxID=13773 RepID=UPI0023F4B4B3|nr:hypothetical protein [Pyrobaculum aerophilum]MCX8136841.1 hypothetical protein [Pyrobaculum aerophilum]
MEPRSFYDVTEAEDRRELAQWIKAGVFNYAVLIPDDLPKVEIVETFKMAGFNHVEIDDSSWPRRIVVKTEGGSYIFRKIEEGVYKIERS